MNYYLGIDGGGTKTKVCIMTENEEILVFFEDGPSSIDTVKLDVTDRNIRIPTMRWIESLSVPFRFKAVFAGIGGIVTEEDSFKVESILRTLPGVDEQTKVKASNDTRNALASGLCFSEGVALIVGTGSVAFGIDSFGKSHKSGGWGYKEGDAGSAYDLGIQAVRAMIRSYDGRADMNSFANEIFKHLGMNKTEDVIGVLDDLWENRTKVAAIAPIVTKHADLGNPHALDIVEHATNELTSMVRAVVSRLNLHEKRLVIIGGLGNAHGTFRTMLLEKIRLLDPSIQPISPLIDPALAACLLAKRL